MFQGLKATGLELLKVARKETGLPIVTEIMSVSDLPLFEDVDVLQLGAIPWREPSMYQGEKIVKNSRVVVTRTIGVCNDCGMTWYTDAYNETRKRKTWLGVLGWIFIFPVLLTVLMVRKKEMSILVRTGIIAAAWLVYFMIGLA